MPEPKGSMPGYKHPIVVVQAEKFNKSNLLTVVGVVVTTNLRLAKMPGNVELSPHQSGLSFNSVVNMTQIVTANKSDLIEFVGMLPDNKVEQIEKGLREVLSLR